MCTILSLSLLTAFDLNCITIPLIHISSIDSTSGYNLGIDDSDITPYADSRKFESRFLKLYNVNKSNHPWDLNFNHLSVLCVCVCYVCYVCKCVPMCAYACGYVCVCDVT